MIRWPMARLSAYALAFLWSTSLGLSADSVTPALRTVLPWIPEGATLGMDFATLKRNRPKVRHCGISVRHSGKGESAPRRAKAQVPVYLERELPKGKTMDNRLAERARKRTSRPTRSVYATTYSTMTYTFESDQCVAISVTRMCSDEDFERLRDETFVACVSQLGKDFKRHCRIRLAGRGKLLLPTFVWHREGAIVALSIAAPSPRLKGRSPSVVIEFVQPEPMGSRTRSMRLVDVKQADAAKLFGWADACLRSADSVK